MALPVVLTDDLSAADQRAIRRALNARTEEPVQRRAPESVREMLEAFERGDDDLFGYPRALADFPKLYERFR